MQSTNKGLLQKTGPWFRVGILTLSTLAPIISRALSHLLDKREDRSPAKVSNKLSYELGQRGERVKKELAQRGKQAKEELVQRSERVKKELVQRGKQAKQELTQQKKEFWAVLGFGLGLIVAGIVTFHMIRQRLLQQTNGEPPIQLPYDAGNWPIATSIVPEGTTFVGIIDRKHYYPIETLPDELAMLDENLLDVVYFTSEEDAKAQGFSAAK
ncbi:MAG TPA: hypothetical protein VGL94_09575 [Ktedonobacteraceae bacterium]|jgi:hypothetical protein